MSTTYSVLWLVACIAIIGAVGLAVSVAIAVWDNNRRRW